MTDRPLHSHLGRQAAALIAQELSPSEVGKRLLDTILHVATTDALDTSDMGVKRHEVRRRLHRAAHEFAGLAEGAAIQEERRAGITPAPSGAARAEIET